MFMFKANNQIMYLSMEEICSNKNLRNQNTTIKDIASCLLLSSADKTTKPKHTNKPGRESLSHND